MENYIDHTGADTPLENSEFEIAAGLPTWCAFALGGVITFLFVYIGIARPAAREMALMRRQMSTLEQSVWEVAGQKETAASTNELLGLLSDQREQLISAKESLAAMKKLHASIIEESIEVNNAIAAASQLGSLKDVLLANSERASEAAEVLSLSEDLYHRLATGAESTELAIDASEDLFSLRSGLIQQGQEVAQAQDRLDDLVALKDAVVDQTNDLADAVETLELTRQLNVRFHQAAMSLDSIRHWMVEIVAMEPMLQRAQKTLEPLTELTSLDRLNPNRVREIARALTQGYTAQVASKPEPLIAGDSQDDAFDFDFDIDEISAEASDSDLE